MTPIGFNLTPYSCVVVPATSEAPLCPRLDLAGDHSPFPPARTAAPCLARADRPGGGDGQWRDRYLDGRPPVPGGPGGGGHRRQHLCHRLCYCDGRAACAYSGGLTSLWGGAPCRDRRRRAAMRLAGLGPVAGRLHRVEKSRSAAGVFAPDARGGTESARLPRRRRLGGARRAVLPRLLRLHHRHRPAATGDGLQPARPRAEGAAQLGLHVRPFRLSGPGRRRLRLVLGGHHVDRGDAGLGMVPARCRLRTL